MSASGGSRQQWSDYDEDDYRRAPYQGADRFDEDWESGGQMGGGYGGRRQQRQFGAVKLLHAKGANPDKKDAAAGYSAREYAKRDTRNREILAAIEASGVQS